MGGNAFKDEKGSLLASDIELRYVEPTLNDFLTNHLKRAGVDELNKIGSTGKKAVSGDLDISVDIGDTNQKQFKDDLLKSLKLTISDGDAKLLGSNIAVLYPVVGKSGSYVQIDIMPVKDSKNTAWLMSGTGTGIRGSWRNMLFAYLARSLSDSLSDREKVTLSFPGGIQKKVLPEPHDPAEAKSKRRWEPSSEKTADPKVVLDTLGINAKPEDVTRFEDLVDILNADPKFRPLLAGFEDYIDHSTFSKKGQEEAINYLNSVIQKSNQQIGEQALREVIQIILNKQLQTTL